MKKVIYDGAMPDPLLGFEKITRYWDDRNSLYAAKLGPGEFYVSTQGEMITTVLGSCIAACIRDPKTGVGGMNHFMLPTLVSDNKDWKGTPVSLETRYGNIAMERLINVIMSNGGKRENLEIKLFGGGKMFDVSDSMDVGQKNIEFVKQYIKKEGFSIKSGDLGGTYPRKIQYYPTSGRLRMKKLYRIHNDTIVRREIKYNEILSHVQPEGAVEIFK